MNSTLDPPPCSIHSRACAITARTSATPLMTADRVANGASNLLGEQSGEGRLAGTRWAPQQHRRQVAALDHPAQRTALADQVFLADEFVKCPRVACARRAGRGHPCPRDRATADSMDRDAPATFQIIPTLSV